MALWIFKEPFVPVKRCLHVFFLGSSLQIVLDTHAHKIKTEFILKGVCKEVVLKNGAASRQ